MSDEEVDQELSELQNLKNKLLRTAINLRNEFQEWEQTTGNVKKTNKDFLPEKDELKGLSTQTSATSKRVSKQCIALSGFISGVKFDDVDKNWISGQKYQYTATVKSKVLEFNLEVTVSCEDTQKLPKILGINCHFINLSRCYFLEIKSWIHRFTDANDTSNLFSAVSDYTEHNVTRAKILKKFRTHNMVSVKECIDEDGGIIVLLQMNADPDLLYFEIRWVLRFIESMWKIDNFFVIRPICAGDDFLKEHNQLLQSFCQQSIKPPDLEALWTELCSVVERDISSQSTTTL